MILYKQEVINKLAEKTGLYKKDVRAVLLALNELVYEEIDADNAILLKNLFKIEPVTIKTRNRSLTLRHLLYRLHRTLLRRLMWNWAICTLIFQTLPTRIVL